MVNQPVLIVDDEVEMRIAMSETLKHCGYPVEISHNAIDALKKVQAKRIFSGHYRYDHAKT
jgi:CheY-like chemotaxis protein